jgi:hypothetical protein
MYTSSVDPFGGPAQLKHGGGPRTGNTYNGGIQYVEPASLQGTNCSRRSTILE